MAPSPTSANTGRSGWANLAAIAYGTPGPIVARLPESVAIMPRRSFRSLANQLAAEPESLVRIAPSGSLGESSQNTRCGLIGSALCIARSSSSCHQSETLASIVSRHCRSGLCTSSGSSARSVARASPTRFSSIG